MLNDSTSSKTNDQKQTVDTIPPVFVDQGDLPPMINSSAPSIPPTDITNPSPATVTGSAAPTDDIVSTVMPAITTSGTPKKKFAGGKIIATILGLFLLIGGVGAGVYLTGQNQNPNEKADVCVCVSGNLNGCDDNYDCFGGTQKACDGTICAPHYDCVNNECVYSQTDNPPGDETAPPAVIPVCQSTTISKNTLTGPGDSLTITSTATASDITGFSYGFYNLDNLYGPSNPKPIWFTANTDYTHAETVSPTNSHTTTVTYDELNRPDLNGGGKPTHIQVNAFFGNSAGWNHSDAKCVVQFNITLASTRPDYCVSASADLATMNLGDKLALSSVSNTAVNGFFWVAYNLDNLYGPSNPKPVCTGNGSKPDECPNGGTPLIFSDPNNSSTAGQKLRTNGSTYVPYAELFVTDKNTGQQVKNLQFNAYFSLNGGQVSWPQPNCVAYTKMATVSLPPNATISCTSLTSNVANPVVGQEITGTCHGNVTGTNSAVARFAVTLNGTVLGASGSIPLNAAGTASYTATVPQEGNYLVQCQICTDSTLSNCTTMGQAN